MPDVRIPDPIKAAINRQPERSHPSFFSFNKTTAILLEESLKARREKLKKGPKLK